MATKDEIVLECHERVLTLFGQFLSGELSDHPQEISFEFELLRFTLQRIIEEACEKSYVQGQQDYVSSD